MGKGLSKVNDANVLFVFVKPFLPACRLYDVLRKTSIERLAIKARQLLALGFTENFKNLLRACVCEIGTLKCDVANVYIYTSLVLHEPAEVWLTSMDDSSVIQVRETLEKLLGDPPDNVRLKGFSLLISITANYISKRWLKEVEYKTLMGSVRSVMNEGVEHWSNML